ncbi:MAG: UDP-N-acetylenolpyruvoylglucosamine reductase [bacterium ADurb.Bin400]|nr:MAG: UDP-N-acetylenolpyruvoylglucosamine reductase [bacterium ADurb.Bin400]
MIKKNVPLNKYCHYRIGGLAKYFLEVNNIDDVINGLNEWKTISNGLNLASSNKFILGAGTNLLIDDHGYDGLVIRNNIRTINANNRDITFGAGLLFSEAIDYCIDQSLSGFEWAGGLPGTVGGAIRGNAGAFGGETKDNIVNVTSVNIETLEIINRPFETCEFNYRSSIYKTLHAKDELIVNGTFRFEPGNQAAIKQAVQEKINYRQSHQPLQYPSAGSTFKNVDCRLASGRLIESCQHVLKTDPMPVIPVAHLLSEAGLKGTKIGGAMISEMHPNFIVNVDNATAKDVLDLINLAKKTIKNKYAVEIEPEIIYLTNNEQDRSSNISE